MLIEKFLLMMMMMVTVKYILKMNKKVENSTIEFCFELLRIEIKIIEMNKEKHDEEEFLQQSHFSFICL